MDTAIAREANETGASDRTTAREHPATESRALKVRSDVSDIQWDEYVNRHENASAYHRSGWCHLIARAFRHESRMLAVENDAGLTGVLPLIVMRSRLFGRFVVSLPFVNAGGVLADDGPSASALLDAAVGVAKAANADYLELRHTERRFAHLAERRHKVAMTLQLHETVDRQWEALDRKIRNQIRKAEKSRLHVREGGLEAVEGFYAVFARNMRDLGTPVFGIALFEEVLRTFPENSRIVSVYQDDRPVAASILHWREGSIEVIWASALREFNAVCANPLMYWHMLRFAIAHGCRVFEFGRCTPGEGPFQFKRQWGAEPSELVWEYWTPSGSFRQDLSPKSATFSQASGLWQHLPLSIANFVGPRIVRSIPC
jgi:serine/alanine adding enzyme